MGKYYDANQVDNKVFNLKMMADALENLEKRVAALERGEYKPK